MYLYDVVVCVHRILYNKTDYIPYNLLKVKTKVHDQTHVFWVIVSFNTHYI